MQAAARILTLALVIATVVACSQDTPPAEGSGGTTSGSSVFSPQDLSDKAGVPIYPGAHMPNGKSSFTEDPRETHYTLIMSTTDSPSKVLEYYKTNIQNADANASRVMGFGKNGSSVIVTATASGGSTEIKAVAVVEKSKS